jgi:formylglycine-generating enzyme required for sulfatase activity
VGTSVDATTGFPQRIRRRADRGEMALVPAGPSRPDAAGAEGRVEKAYYLDVTEVTNEQFERFAAAKGHVTAAERAGKGYALAPGADRWALVDGASWRAPLGAGQTPTDWRRHPVVLVSHDDARAFAAWAGAALPTEGQFERALRGGRDAAPFPWDGVAPPARFGNFPDAALRRGAELRGGLEGYDDGHARTAPVGTFEANAFGLEDLAGNVSEWCAAGETGGAAFRCARGGAWGGPAALQSGGRLLVGGAGDDTIGFRCARSLP